MIRFLHIQHLAVIDELALELEPGLNVITGETGAGKSIILEALNLLLGTRASADLVRTGESQASVQAIFEGADGQETIVRREISAQGRSRAFIDHALATSASLKELGARTVDLHGQHEHQLLLNPETHLDVLDEYARTGSAREGVAEAFRRFRTVREELDRLHAARREQGARAEFLSFQLSEIQQVAPKPDEDTELAASRQVLANADRLQRLCAEAYAELYEGDEAVLPALASIWRKLGELATVDGRFTSYVEARDGVKSQLEDLAYFLREYASSIEASPERLEDVEARLVQIERLKKKYGTTLAEVQVRATALADELRDAEQAPERAAALEAELERGRTAYLAAAQVLSVERHRHAPVFARRLEALLGELAMERTRCEVRFRNSTALDDAWTARGFDDVELFLSANPGEELRPLARIASGGELSRIMLALKTLAATDAPGKTLVFDEVDAGIGGRVADILGQRLRHLAGRFQVLCVTHLPQIASYGSAHYHVSKRLHGGRSVTRVQRLEGEGRIEEIARMMAGAQVSDRARASARELLSNKVIAEHKAKVKRR